MKKLKLKTLTWWNKVLVLFMGLLGIGCKGGSIIVPEYGVIAMYGVPYGTVEVKGTVTNESKEPIQGIRVSLNNDFDLAETKTDDKGEFAIDVDIFPTDTIHVKVEDIDGVRNGGEFQSDSTAVKLRFRGGDGSWDNGQAKATVNFVLKPKE